ncbi:MAG: hypothetical protein RJA76_821 [Bacteroidota bacterium]
MKAEKVYDVAIIGAGASGLQLLYELIQADKDQQLSILLFDSGDRTSKSWCFWTSDTETSFPFLVEKSWKKMRFCNSQNQTKAESIAPYSYHYISSSHFFSYFFEKFIPNDPRIVWVNQKVKQVSENASDVVVICENGQQFKALKVADSRLEYIPENGIKQHFSGKFISFDQAIFDSDCFTIMDFSLGFSTSEMAVFHYILPFSPHQALIETTVFTSKDFDSKLYSSIWSDYVKQKFGNKPFQILSEENGSIPMHRIVGPKPTKIFKIGVSAGKIKPSTGYAFNRMHQHAKSIANQNEFTTPKRFAFYDKMLLKIMKNEMIQIPSVMDRLFAKVSFVDILRFLDDKSSLSQDISLLSKLDIPLFLKHFLK